MRQLAGIRNKITIWFYLVLSFMIVSSVIIFWVVRVMEETHFNMENADVFLKDILEVRRMENNFLFYKDQHFMEQWATYLDGTTRQLVSNKELFIRLSSLSEMSEVEQALQAYKVIFAEFGNPEADGKLIAAKIREQGNKVTTLAEELIVRVHQSIHRLFALIRNSLLFMLPFLVLIFGSIAALLGRGIVSSLKQLEQHAATIAAGNFVELPLVSTNREVNSLINAFNQMSRELKNRQQQLARSEKLASLGTMLAGVAHEFNSPLSNISSSAQILAEELDAGDESFNRELALQISTETNRASAIVRTLLSLAREKKFHRDYYPLKILCQEIVVLLRVQIAADIDIQLVISDDISIFADKQKLQQVFINLLKNSSDALGFEGTIQIRAWQQQAGIKIVISDDGPGIPRQLQEKIFDPFFSTKDTGQGAGLGLSIVRDIVSQHGGQIRIDNAGEGTTFIINLPGGES